LSFCVVNDHLPKKSAVARMNSGGYTELYYYVLSRMSFKLKTTIALLAAVCFSSSLALAGTYHMRIPLRTLSVAPATGTGTATGPGTSTGTDPSTGSGGTVGTGIGGSESVGGLGSGPAVEVPPPVQPISTGYTTAGTYYVTVPDGYTSMSVKLWGAGGGGTRYTSGGTGTISSGTGGGGGFTSGTLGVTPGMTFQVVVGSGGQQSAAPFYGGPGRGGGTYQGGGYSGIFLNSISQANALFVAGGGGGGGITISGGVCTGANSYLIAGGGGGLAGVSGSGAGGGTQTAGGTGGTKGSILQGGSSLNVHVDCGVSGGGGGGYFGGGGGSVSSNNTSGGSGGGGSSFAVASASNVTMEAGTKSSVPANSADPDRASAGQGGGAFGKAATPGNVIITFN
jgi:hypothetical protein